MEVLVNGFVSSDLATWSPFYFTPPGSISIVSGWVNYLTYHVLWKLVTDVMESQQTENSHIWNG